MKKILLQVIFFLVISSSAAVADSEAIKDHRVYLDINDSNGEVSKFKSEVRGLLNEMQVDLNNDKHLLDKKQIVIQSQLDQYKIELESIVKRSELSYKDTSDDLEYIRSATMLVLLIASVLIASSFLYVLRENANVKIQMEMINDKFNIELEKTIKEIKLKMGKLEVQAEREINNMIHAHLLKLLMSEEVPDPSEVYSHLTVLAYAPDEKYHPLITKILKKDISSDINKLAVDALKNKHD